VENENAVEANYRMKFVFITAIFKSFRVCTSVGRFEELHVEVVLMLHSSFTFKTLFVPQHLIHCSVHLDISIVHLYTGANVPQIRALEAYSCVLQ
jgi:hypothetical protein